MALGGFTYFERRSLDKALKRWSEMADGAKAYRPSELTATVGRFSSLRHQLDRARTAAEIALVGQMRGDEGITRPEQCDWVYRPGLWREPILPAGQVGLMSPTDLGGGVTLFHDSGSTELSYRQVRNTRSDVGAAFGLVFEVYRFDGSFLSLVQDLPDAALEGLTRDHFLQVALCASLESPLEVYARLNVQHGPNCEQMVRQIAFDGDRGLAEFDLAYSKINEKRLEKMWLDLIFEGPQMNQVKLWDMSVARAPRADI